MAFEFGTKLGAKLVINLYAPGWSGYSAASIEFIHAIKCFCDGDKTGGFINILSGIGELASLGLMGTIKDTIKGSAKANAVAAVKGIAKSVPKEMSKKIGQQAAKEFAKGVVTEATEEVLRKGTKMTVYKTGLEAFIAAMSSGGHQVGTIVVEDLSEKLAFEMMAMMAESTKMGAFELTKNAAMEGAKREFMKNSYKLVTKDVIIGISKGAANSYGRKDN